MPITSFFGKQFETPKNIGRNKKNEPILHTSVQPRRNGDFMSLWDSPGSGDDGDVVLDLVLTEDQLTKICNARQKANAPKRGRS